VGAKADPGQGPSTQSLALDSAEEGMRLLQRLELTLNPKGGKALHARQVQSVVERGRARNLLAPLAVSESTRVKDSPAVEQPPTTLGFLSTDRVGVTHNKVVEMEPVDTNNKKRRSLLQQLRGAGRTSKTTSTTTVTARARGEEEGTKGFFKFYKCSFYRIYWNLTTPIQLPPKPTPFFLPTRRIVSTMINGSSQIPSSIHRCPLLIYLSLPVDISVYSLSVLPSPPPIYEMRRYTSIFFLLPAHTYILIQYSPASVHLSLDPTSQPNAEPCAQPAMRTSNPIPARGYV